MQHEMHDSSEHRAKDDRGPAFCKYPYAVIAPAAQSDPAVVPKNLNRLTGAGYLEAVQRDFDEVLNSAGPLSPSLLLNHGNEPAKMRVVPGEVGSPCSPMVSVSIISRKSSLARLWGASCAGAGQPVRTAKTDAHCAISKNIHLPRRFMVARIWASK